MECRKGLEYRFYFRDIGSVCGVVTSVTEREVHIRVTRKYEGRIGVHEVGSRVIIALDRVRER
jgi:hypothetical protein